MHLADRDPCRAGVDCVEERVFGAGHPHLAAACEAGEQRGAAGWIEVCGNLVEEQDGGLAGAFGDEVGVGEDDAEQERLLLAGRGERGRAALVEVGDDEVDPVGPAERAPGGGIAGAALGEVGLQARGSPAQPSSVRPARGNGPSS